MIETLEITRLFSSPWIIVAMTAVFTSMAIAGIGAFVLMLCVSMRVLGFNISAQKRGTDAAQERERAERSRIERSMAGKIVGGK